METGPGDIERLERIRQRFGSDAYEDRHEDGRWIVRPGDGPWFFDYIDRLRVDVEGFQQVTERGQQASN